MAGADASGRKATANKSAALATTSQLGSKTDASASLTSMTARESLVLKEKLELAMDHSVAVKETLTGSLLLDCATMIRSGLKNTGAASIVNHNAAKTNSGAAPESDASALSAVTSLSGVKTNAAVSAKPVHTLTTT